MAKIMIVDDAAFMRITIKNMLKKSSHEVVGEAETGKLRWSAISSQTRTSLLWTLRCLRWTGLLL